LTALDITVARAEALFASTLSTSEPHDRAELKAAIAAAVQHYGGVRGCAELMAEAFGDHPAAAAERMRWAVSAAMPLAFHQGEARLRHGLHAGARPAPAGHGWR
jgi:hypothetical protein